MICFRKAAQRRRPNFGKLVADETEKWRKVVEFAACSPEP
jgi:hypothetical protein